MKLPQDSIRVTVDYYDEAEKTSLANFPSATQISNVSGKTITIPTGEFLTYYMFRRKRPGMPGLRDYRELAHKMEVSLGDLEGSVQFDGHSIHVVPSLDELDNHIAERIGEAVGLSVINKIHGMTEADWGRIRKSGGRNAKPSLDFEIASDGTTLVQVETKGSFTPRSDLKVSAVGNHRANIRTKKAQLALATANAQENPNAIVRFGTIGVIGGPGTQVRCWLLDPPPDQINFEAARVRLLNRMAFLRDWISFLSSRSALATALANRMADLEILNDPWELDGRPLRRGNGDELGVATGMFANERNPFFATKSYIADGPTGGVVVQGFEQRLFFLGIREELLGLAAKQDFRSIVDYISEAGVVRKRIVCQVSERRFSEMLLPDALRADAELVGGYRRFELWANLSYTKSGVAFGELDFDDFSD